MLFDTSSSMVDVLKLSQNAAASFLESIPRARELTTRIRATSTVFYADPRVLYVSLHQWPLYPGTGSAREVGEGDGLGTTLNLPEGTPGIVMAIHTFGEYIDFHPHLHALVADGLFTRDGKFHVMAEVPLKPLDHIGVKPNDDS
jgi:hypothetical protein